MYANQSDKKSNFNFLQKGGGGYTILKSFEICLLCSLNSQKKHDLNDGPT